MTPINEWANRWGIPPEAIKDLQNTLVSQTPDPKTQDGESEAAIQTRIRLEASRKGARLFRNNVGATYTEDGSFLRYGLANDSKAMNDHIKSHDLIGIRPVLIEPHHVGKIIGQFVSREVKAAGWKYRGTEREEAQLRWAILIASMGGDACFANGEGTI
jgi:hypothetical protein